MAHATPELVRSHSDAPPSHEPWMRKPVDDALWDTEWVGLLPPWGVSTPRALEDSSKQPWEERAKTSWWQRQAHSKGAGWNRGTSSQWKRESRPPSPPAERGWQAAPPDSFPERVAEPWHTAVWEGHHEPSSHAPDQPQVMWMAEEVSWPASGAGVYADYGEDKYQYVEYPLQYPATSAELMMANGHMSMGAPTMAFGACNGDAYEPHWNLNESGFEQCFEQGVGAYYGASSADGWIGSEIAAEVTAAFFVESGQQSPPSQSPTWVEGQYWGADPSKGAQCEEKQMQAGGEDGGGQDKVDSDLGGSPSSEQLVPESGLKPSASSWGEQQRLRRENGCGGVYKEDAPPAEVARQARGILNKLSTDNFELLSEQVLALPLHTSEQLAAVVAEIFETATLQRVFLPLYSDLCVRLDAHLAKEGGTCVGGKAFRKALVAECQASFERQKDLPLEDEALDGLSYEERYECEVKQKTRTLGNMRFIGELLVHRLLAGKVLLFVVNELLDLGTGPALESLVALLTVIAPTFEHKDSIYAVPLREVFESLRRKAKDPSLSTCVRCKIRDLLDARKCDWAPKAHEPSRLKVGGRAHLKEVFSSRAGLGSRALADCLTPLRA